MLQHIEFFGDTEQGFSGHPAHVGISSENAGLSQCKFCKGNNQRVVNTNAPSYWIECKCGIELHASYISEDGNSYCDLDTRHDDKDINSVKNAHHLAIAHIINKWNKSKSPE